MHIAQRPSKRSFEQKTFETDMHSLLMNVGRRYHSFSKRVMLPSLSAGLPVVRSAERAVAPIKLREIYLLHNRVPPTKGNNCTVALPGGFTQALLVGRLLGAPSSRSWVGFERLGLY